MSGGELEIGRDSEGGSCRKDEGLGSSLESSSATATTIPPVERDGSLAVAGEEVEAEEGTGFLLTGSVLGTMTLECVDGGVEEGGLAAEMSRRVGRPRSIILQSTLLNLNLRAEGPLFP